MAKLWGNFFKGSEGGKPLFLEHENCLEWGMLEKNCLFSKGIANY